jgi:adenylate cyclase, class 2
MPQEIEAKFYVTRLAELRRRVNLIEDAKLLEPRVLERNLRFDTATQDLRRAGQVLRLRQDRRSRLTYKDSGRFEAGTLNRRELELDVSDFGAAQQLLEALGYQVIFIYEKYRTTYELGQHELMLDEMPYGTFVEIEGEPGGLQSAAQLLGLNWQASIPDSYSALFERLHDRLRLDFRDLTFENFEGVRVSADDLAVSPAD